MTSRRSPTCAPGCARRGCACWSPARPSGARARWSTIRSGACRCCPAFILLTALPTTVRYGQDEGVRAVFADGRAERFPLAALEDLVTERHNPGNRRNLGSVTVLVDEPVLARGVELVDTPGTGSVYAHNTAAAETALETMDAAVFVLTADPPVSASERELMTRVAARSVRMFVVLNKTDYLAPGELAEAVEFTGQVVGEAAGRPVRVYPLSARAALTARDDPGFRAFHADFISYLDRERAADLQLSAVTQARRLAGSLRDEVALTRRAAELRSGDAAGQVAAFAARLAAVAARGRDAADLVRADSARLLAELNQAAQRAARDRTRPVGDELTVLLDGPLRSAGAAEIERPGGPGWPNGRRGAESWRQRQAAQLEGGLARLDARMIEDLRAELAAVRAAAADLLGLALTMPGGAERLAPDLRFFYLVAENAGQTELLAGAIRRHLPGEAGRRRARAYLRREVAELVPRLIGRARADLQYRLAEATPMRPAGQAFGTGPPPPRRRSSHRYVIVVQAIRIEKVGQLQVQADSTPAWLGFMINTSGHLLGRAVITAWAWTARLWPCCPPCAARLG